MKKVFLVCAMACLAIVMNAANEFEVWKSFDNVRDEGFTQDSVLCADSVQIVATPDSGYVFDYWSGNLDGTQITDDTILTIPSVKMDYLDIVANFKLAGFKVTITTECLNGSPANVGPITTTITPVDGTPVTKDHTTDKAFTDDVLFTDSYSAVATTEDDCYRFVAWLDAETRDTLSKDPNYGFTVEAKDYNLIALYEKIPYTVSAKTDGHGSISAVIYRKED